MVKFLIACSGQSQRWDNYMGVAKHLIKINGERLLDRTIRLIRERAKEDYTINVIAFDEKYKANGSILQIPQYETQAEKDEHFANPFLYVSKRWWNSTGTTVILFGDVYFTEDAMDTIITSLYNLNNYAFYGRPDASTFTGCGYGEIFGVSFTRDYSDNLWNTILEVKKLKDENKIKRFISWEVYRKLQLIDLDRHEIKNNFISIDDFTEDFDYPHDYDLCVHDSLHTKFHMIKELLYFKKTNKEKFLIFFDDQNSESFWDYCFRLKLYEKTGFNVKWADGNNCAPNGHLGGFLKFEKNKV